MRIFLFLFFVAIGFTTSLAAQNGQLIKKTLIDLKQEVFWDDISKGGSLKSEYKHLDTLNFYKIKYWSDSLQIKGVLIEPKAAGKYPVVIFNRGGNRTFAEISIQMASIYTGKLAAEGYIILASNYRKNDEFGGKDLNDVLHIIETAQYIPKADTSKIGMFGWSRGGMMTYLTLKHTKKIKAAIVGNGPTNLFSIIEARPGIETNVLQECIPNYPALKTQALEKRSAIFWPDKLCKTTPLLILNGTMDIRMDYHQTIELAKKLNSINYPFQLKLFETDHFFSNKKKELNFEVISWFNQHLK